MTVDIDQVALDIARQFVDGGQRKAQLQVAIIEAMKLVRDSACADAVPVIPDDATHYYPKADDSRKWRRKVNGKWHEWCGGNWLPLDHDMEADYLPRQLHPQPEALNEVSGTSGELGGYEGHTWVSDYVLSGLRERAAMPLQLRDGEVWHWQGDGHDFPESLSCPVIMSAESLRGLLYAATGMRHVGEPEVEFQARLMDVKTDLPTENWRYSPTYEENPGRGTRYWVQYRKRYIYYTPPATQHPKKVPWQIQLADALDCAWNPAIEADHNHQGPGAVLAGGLAAVAARLREQAADEVKP